jgi:hypothetical protein
MSKSEIRNSKSENRLPFGCLQPMSPGKSFEFRISNFEFLRRFRFPRRRTPLVEQTARVARLFEVNFRTTWIR